MTESTADLIPMAEIARLAGQSRATVGNWKSRHEDFPVERGRTPRGPLYDRAEVVEWLERMNRLDGKSPEAIFRAELTKWCRLDVNWVADMPALMLVVLALKTMCSEEDWDRLAETVHTRDEEDVLRQLVQTTIPFAQELLPWGQLDGDAIVGAILMIANLDSFGPAETMAEVILDHFGATLDRRHGEYDTPLSVRKLVTGLAQPANVVYNPASGMGQLLVDVATSIDSHGSVNLFGQEPNSRAYAISQLNLAIRNVDAAVASGDVFAKEAFPNLRADCVIAVPPWNAKIPQLFGMADDPRWIFGEPGPSDGNAAWMQHCLYHLADGGRAILVLPSGALFETGRAGRIRQRIVKAGLLDAVIALPAGLFPWSAIACAVLVLSKRGAGQRASLMVDLSGAGERARGATTLGAELIREVVGGYQRWADGEPPGIVNAAIAGFDDIAENDFAIVPARYQPVADIEPDVDKAMDKRRDLIRRLGTLTVASREADKQLTKFLGARQ